MDYLTSEHPKTMSALSGEIIRPIRKSVAPVDTSIIAILITAGTIPALPAIRYVHDCRLLWQIFTTYISAGAGGAILASHAAQAVGTLFSKLLKFLHMHMFTIF
jgi:hypothetical protein